MNMRFSAAALFVAITASIGGCDGGSGTTLIEAAPGTTIPTEEQLKKENEARTAAMSGGAAEMSKQQGN